MSEFFDDHHRAVQDRFETRALADRVAAITVHTEIQESDKLFIESRDMLFLASVVLLCQTKLLVLDHVGKYNVVC